MKNQYRLALIASLLGLSMIATATNALAEAGSDAANQCAQQAEESGLTGADRENFLKECMEADKEHSGEKAQ